MCHGPPVTHACRPLEGYLRHFMLTCTILMALSLSQQAVADENYEEAATLEAEITELATIVNSSSSAVDFAALRETLVAALEEKQKLWDEEAELHQSSVDTLRGSMGKQQEELRSFKSELEAATADESAELAATTSRIERARQHLDLDRQHLEQQVEKYNAKAEGKSAAFVAERNKLQKSREEVRQKIEELQLQMDTLKSEDADLTSGIAVQEERIEQAESSLSTEKKRVEGERTALLKTEKQLNTDQEELDAATTKLDDSTAGLRSKRDALDASMGQTREHVAFAIRAKHTVEGRKTGFAQFFETHSVFAAVESVLADVESGELAELKAAAATKEAAVAALLASVQGKQKEASTLRKSLEENASRVPELQVEKKTAVSGRNFKEAARITAEIKELAAKEETEKELLKGLTADLAAEVEAHAEAQATFDALRSELDGQVAEADRGCVSKLRAKGEEIRAAIENPANANEEVIKLLRADADACELMEETLAVKHRIEWTPPEVPLDDIVANALAVLKGKAEASELLALEDADADADAASSAGDEMEETVAEDGGKAQAAGQEEQEQQDQQDQQEDEQGDEQGEVVAAEEAEGNGDAKDGEAEDEEGAKDGAGGEDQGHGEDDRHDRAEGAEGKEQHDGGDGGEGGEGGEGGAKDNTDSADAPKQPAGESIRDEIAKLEAEIEAEIAKEDDADYERCEELQERVDALKESLA